MYCPFCGAELTGDPETEYCSVCGKKIPKHNGSTRITRPIACLSLAFGIISLLCALFTPQFGFLGFFGVFCGLFRFGNPDRYFILSLTGIILSVLAVIIYLFRIFR